MLCKNSQINFLSKFSSDGLNYIGGMYSYPKASFFRTLFVQLPVLRCNYPQEHVNWSKGTFHLCKVLLSVFPWAKEFPKRWWASYLLSLCSSTGVKDWVRTCKLQSQWDNPYFSSAMAMVNNSSVGELFSADYTVHLSLKNFLTIYIGFCKLSTLCLAFGNYLAFCQT